ncbi:MAG: NAD(P)-dependent oxidoreductase [Alphaproteobacteria bacterium]|nr:NAD(P)-dependent oxidoreductase [Alphaproteobacteria bacterium]
MRLEPGKTVLVTGGNGFVGSYVARELALAGHKVVAFGRSPVSAMLARVQAPGRERIVWAQGDVTDAQALRAACVAHGAAAIVHAATAGAAPARPTLNYEVDVMGAVQACDAVRELGLARVVLISSNAVYGERRYQPIDERHPTGSIKGANAFGHYSAGKQAMETAGLAFASRHGVDVVALRLSSVYGFAMSGDLHIRPFVEAIATGAELHRETSGDMIRDFVSVKDCAVAARLALTAPFVDPPLRVFNVSYGVLHHARDVVATLKALAPETRISIGPGMTPAERADSLTRGALCGREAHAVLGFKAATDLRAGLADYLAEQRAYAGARP